MDRQSAVILTFFGLVVAGIIVYQLGQTSPALSALPEQTPLPGREVCMVNDTYMGVDQIPVEVAGRMYYGCCEMCVEKLNTLEEVRYAIDPYTGRKVDKSAAFIVLKTPSTGEVLYFESRQTYQQYQNNPG